MILGFRKQWLPVPPGKLVIGVQDFFTGEETGSSLYGRSKVMHKAAVERVVILVDPQNNRRAIRPVIPTIREQNFFRWKYSSFASQGRLTNHSRRLLALAAYLE